MKISEFAKKLNINVSTVRFYINHGLIVPNREGEQYEFDSKCLADMKEIIRLKGYHFTLEEIQLLIFLEKTSRFKDEVVLKLYKEILERKQQELIAERDDLSEYISSLGTEIDSLPKAPIEESGQNGIPFSFIPNLYCPKCQTPLKLDSASISNGFLKDGNLWCECGYKATIEDGLLLCNEHFEETPFKAFENIESVSTITDQFSSTYRKLYDTTYLYMYKKISSKLSEPQTIMIGPFTLNFLLAYIDNLGSNHTYIVVDPSKKRIEKLRSYLPEKHHNIIFVAGYPKDLPFKKKILDIYIDDYSTVNTMFTYNTFGTEHIAPLLKRGSIVTGIYSDYRQSPGSLKNFANVLKGFKPELMTLNRLKYDWEQGGVKISETKSIGYTAENEMNYAQDVLGEKIEVLGYYGKKTI